MDRRVLFTMAAVITAAVIMFSVLALPSDAESQTIEYSLNADNYDQKVELTANVGDTLKITGTIDEGKIAGLDTTAIGEIPGINVMAFTKAPDDKYIYEAKGQFAEAGTYSLDTKFYDGTVTTSHNSIITITVLMTEHTVTITAGEGGKVNPDSISEIPSGTTVNADGNTLNIGGIIVTATADEGYEFEKWENAEGKIVSDRTIEAKFRPLYTATITTDGHGTVDRTSITGLSYGTTVSASGNTLSIGTTPVSASENEGYVFKEWTMDGKSITDGTTITSDVTIKAVFEPATVKVTINTEGAGSVDKVELTVRTGSVFTIDGNAIAIDGQKVIAEPADGSGFNHWSVKDGDAAKEDMIVTAYFKQMPGPEPEKNGDKTGFMVGMIVSGTITVILAGLAISGIRSPIVFIIMSVAAVVTVALALLYIGVIRL